MAHTVWDTWAAFKTKFKAQFITANIAQKACNKLQRLQQGKCTVKVHVNHFKFNIADTGITNNETTKDLFCQGLNHNILNAILLHDPLPTSADTWYKWATVIDNNQQNYNTGQR